MGLMPGNDLGLPFEQRAPEAAHLGGCGILKVLAESGDELESQRLILMVIERTDQLLCLPGGRNVTRWVTSSQQSEQFVSSVIAQSFFGFGEQTPGSIERVIFSPPVVRVVRSGLAVDTRRVWCWPTSPPEKDRPPRWRLAAPR